MSKLVIIGIQVDTFMGVYEKEHHTRQTLSIDTEVHLDMAKSAQSDDIQDTINYEQLVASMREFAQGVKLNLIETFIEDLADRLIAEFNMPYLLLRVHKGHALPQIKDLYIEVERGQK